MTAVKSKSCSVWLERMIEPSSRWRNLGIAAPLCKKRSHDGQNKLLLALHRRPAAVGDRHSKFELTGFRRHAAQNPVGREHNASRRCAVGALRSAARLLTLHSLNIEAHNLLLEVAVERGFTDIEKMNDHSMHGQVVSAFDIAIARAQARSW